MAVFNKYHSGVATAIPIPPSFPKHTMILNKHLASLAIIFSLCVFCSANAQADLVFDFTIKGSGDSAGKNLKNNGFTENSGVKIQIPYATSYDATGLVEVMIKLVHSTKRGERVAFEKAHATSGC